MGKQFKRVPFNFDWPQNKQWWGYVLLEVTCQSCGGIGSVVQLLTPASLLKGEIRQVENRERCPTCDGRGRIRPIIEIPQGTGYQLWDTSFAGCPVSPVFQTADELARWLSENKVHAFGTFTLSHEKWLDFILEKNETISALIKSDLDQHLDRLDDRVLDFIEKVFAATLEEVQT